MAKLGKMPVIKAGRKPVMTEGIIMVIMGKVERKHEVTNSE